MSESEQQDEALINSQCVSVTFTCGSLVFGATKALKDVPLNMVVLRVDMPKARCLEVMLMDGPSNSIF